MDHFFAHVAGESHRNADGSDRQAIIPRCRVGELLVLEHEHDNPYDINAIRVLRQSGEQIGYLERDVAGQVVSRTSKGCQFHALVAGIGRAGGRGPYGVALLIVVQDGDASDQDVAAYGQRVLARDRKVEARGAVAAVSKPASRVARPTAAPGDHIVTIAAIVVIGLAAAIAVFLAFR